jgi:hypothetical protein
MKLTTKGEDSKSGSAAKTQHMLRSAVFELYNSHFIDRELLTRLTDIPVTHAGSGLRASSDGKVVTHCTRDENVDATVTRTSDNLTAIGAIHSRLGAV